MVRQRERGRHEHAAFADAAPSWAAAGIVPLPIAPDGKRPLVRHPDRFGQRAALQIMPKFPDANLGFWCGSHNGLTVVDIDSPKDSELQYAQDTFGHSPVIVRTASRKYHAYYRHGGERRRIRPIKGHPIDILGEGGFCIAPPSTRITGGSYEFVCGGLADLSRLPTIRAGALQSREPAPIGKAASSAINAEVVPIGQRNDTVFRLALALAHHAETQADLLAQARKAKAKLADPPLPDAEVQRAVGSAWRYKMIGRLMVPGMDSAILLPAASIKRLLAGGDTDALALITMARKAHGSTPGKPFALAPQAMARARLIGSWGRNRYRDAIRKACDLGELVQITRGGRGKHDPATYRFAQPRKGSNPDPNLNQTLSPLSPGRESREARTPRGAGNEPKRERMRGDGCSP
jgi:Bifunctional DNA primase/polymerase, N-terminal/Primase C terminal 1 (PriCT-1)